MIKYHVVAVSLCTEIEPSELIGVFDTEQEAIDCKVSNTDKYWKLDIRKHCPDCGELIEDCYCDSIN